MNQIVRRRFTIYIEYIKNLLQVAALETTACDRLLLVTVWSFVRQACLDRMRKVVNNSEVERSVSVSLALPKKSTDSF